MPRRRHLRPGDGGAYYTPTQVGTGTSWSEAAASDDGLAIEWSTNYRHSCATKTDGTLWCWGDNTSGKLGDGTTTMHLAPAPVDGGAGTTWSQVATGGQHSCGLQSGGTMACWGDNSFGQLGDGSMLQSSAPVAAAGSGYQSLSSRSGHSCASKVDGSVVCWGSNGSGQLGQGTFGTKSTPTQVGTERWAQLKSGSWRTCGGTAWCWTTALTSGSFSDPPTQVGTATDWTSVSAGGCHVCGTRGQSLWCWGSNLYGQLGDGTAWAETPQVVP